VGACPLCQENELQAAASRPGDVLGMETGWVRLHRNQRYRGAAFFVSRLCVREVYHLDRDVQPRHLDELARVCEAIDVAFSPVKMNIESLGNGVPHLHWWITPRHADDPQLSAPIWENLNFLREMWTGTGTAEPTMLEADAALLRLELLRQGGGD
jgi:diadenosine tetraphosphate (Ap4A) HIT family hydrolase